jgi:hypothetical protein
MTKTKRKTVRAQQAAAQTSSTQPVKTWVKWVALGIVAALGVSIIAGAITATPAQASTTAAYGETGTCLLDTDNDGIANPDDPDIDGDGIINGEDSDIDGDGIDNSQDGDPAATNCNSDAPPPIMAYSTAPVSTEDKATLGLWVTFGSAFAVIALLVIVLVSRRTKKG